MRALLAGLFLVAVAAGAFVLWTKHEAILDRLLGSPASVTLVNNATEPVAKAEVVFRGKAFPAGPIAEGETAEVPVTIRGKGSYSVMITFASGRTISADLGFIASGMTCRDTVEIMDNAIEIVGEPCS